MARSPGRSWQFWERFTKKPPAPAPAPPAPDLQPLFGHDGTDVEGFAFSGGGYDTLMHLGVVHALVVRARQHEDRNMLPHAFSGVSAGAVMAAVAAEVLRQSAGTAEATCASRVSRLRQILHLFLEAPQGLIASLMPDLYEVKSGRPLKSLDVATHNQHERRDRDDAVEARSGLIRLLNQVLSTSIPLSAITRLTRIYLGLRAAREEMSRWRHEVRWTSWRLNRLRAAGREGVRFLIEFPLVSLRYGVSLSDGVLWLYKTTVSGGCGIALERLRNEPGRDPKLATDAGSALSLRRISLVNSWTVVVRLFSILFWYFTVAVLLASVVWHILDLAAYVLGGWAWLDRGAAFAAMAHWAAVVLIGALLALLAIPFIICKCCGVTMTRCILRDLSLDRDLLADYDVRRFLITLLDPGYFVANKKTNHVIAKALRGEGAKGDPAVSKDAATRKKRKLADLSLDNRLHVAPAAVDITRGRLEILEDSSREGEQLKTGDVPLIDALMASTAVVPFLRAQTVENAAADSYYIDASNISSEPLNGLMDYLRPRVSAAATGLRVYAVTPFPVTGPERVTKPITGAIDVADRVTDLQRYQVASLDRRLTAAYTEVLGKPNGRVLTEIPAEGTAKPQRYLSADVRAIETPAPLRLYRQILAAEDEDGRRKAALGAIAIGCHASMQVFEADALKTAFGAGGGTPHAECPNEFAGKWLAVPGTTGLPEVCNECCKRFVNPATVPAKAGVLEVKRPLTPAPTGDIDKPWSVLLLSGGVFRGVFQVGVVAGCLEAGLTPRLLVGSSVGSLMMTAAAKLWSRPAGERVGHLRTLASTFLALDQLVVTDRFADFVRRITLRAGYTDVSIRDIDRAIRTYAESGPDSFNRTTRRVLAAFERLFYVTPFELLELVRAAREDRWEHVRVRALESAQNFLNRSGVRDEVLGSEPLQWLIDQLGKPDGVGHPAFDCYYPQMYRLVTATNLQDGRLEVFGHRAAKQIVTDASFSEALLASGAFPLVFRPRLESDLQPAVAHFAQYTDGGVMDNLPLYSVAKFIAQGARHGLVRRRPAAAPHLLVTGSLEPEFRRKDFSALRAEYWPDVRTRATRIAYNSRAIGFAQAQEHLDRIYEHRTGTLKETGVWDPVRLRVSVIRAQWLCGTFGFHPMLGFSRVRQARNIAHGCASTLAYLSGEAENREWAAEWGLKEARLKMRPDAVDWVERRTFQELRQPTLRQAPALNPARRLGKTEEKGTCWFRTGVQCPFSAQANSAGEDQTQTDWLNLIYKLCREKATHPHRAPD